MKRLMLFALVLLAAVPAQAQLSCQLGTNCTAVSGTITDANGLPYSNAQLSVNLILTGAGPARIGTVDVTPPSTVITLDENGTFATINLWDNNVITPAGSQWQFAVSIPGVPPPMGFGPRSFTVNITITGAAQSVSATLSAAALALSRNTGGVPSTRTISTTAPLLGGGDLSANRTFSLAIPGADQQLFYNDAGAWSAALGLLWDKTNNRLGIKMKAGQATDPFFLMDNALTYFGSIDLNGVAHWAKLRASLNETANPTADAELGLSKTGCVKFRNNANLADLSGLCLNASDQVTLGDAAGAVATGPVTVTTTAPYSFDFGSKPPVTPLANAGVTGTAANKLVKGSGAPLTALITAITDTSGILGVCVASVAPDVTFTCGTTGNAGLANVPGTVIPVVFDSATTAGNIVVNDTSTVGDGMDSGQPPTSAGCAAVTSQRLGVVLTTNGGAGTYDVLWGDPCPATGSTAVPNATTFQTGVSGRTTLIYYHYNTAGTAGALASDAVTATGTCSGVTNNSTTTMLQVDCDSTTGADAIAGWSSAGNTRFGKLVHYAAFIRPVDSAGTAFYWLGMTTTAPTGAGFNNADPSTTSTAAFRLAIGTDTNWQCYLSNGAASTVADSTVAATFTGTTKKFEVIEGASSFTFKIDGTTVCGAMSQTNRPTSTAAVLRMMSIVNIAAGGVSKSISMSRIILEADVY
jgi:hypothetical protein